MFTRCCSPPEKVAGGRLHSRSGRLSPREELARPGPRLGVGQAGREDRLRHEIEGRDARDHAQELRHVGHRGPPERQDSARRGAGDVHHLVAVAHPDAALVAAIGAEDHLEHGGFAGPGRAAEHHALAGRDREADAVDHRQPRAAAQVQGEGLRDVLDGEEGGQ
jgi:hypothetical protein